MKKHPCDTEYKRNKDVLKKDRDLYIAIKEEEIAMKKQKYKEDKAELKTVRDNCKRSPDPTETPTDTDKPKYSWDRLDVGDLTFTPPHEKMMMVRDQQEDERAFSTRDKAIEYLQSIGVNEDNIGEKDDNEKEYTIITKVANILDGTKFVQQNVFQIGQRITKIIS